MILQSKINKCNNTGKYVSARNWLNTLPLDKWIEVELIPQQFSYNVIDLLDRGFDPVTKSVFDPTYSMFLLTRDAFPERKIYSIPADCKPKILFN